MRKQIKQLFGTQIERNNYMKFGMLEAQDYIHRVKNAVGRHMIEPNGIYTGRDGHLRLARECGYALNDFNKEGQDEILSASYGGIYVIGCNLKPLLDAKEWIGEMRKQIKSE